MGFEDDQRLAQFLAQFPGPLVLERSQARKFVEMGVALLLVAGAILYIGREGSITGILTGVLVIAFAGLMVFAPRTLTLDADGFVARSPLMRTRRRWEDVRDFCGRDLRGGTMIYFDQARGVGKLVAAINRATIARNAVIYGNYGLRADELAALMNAWRDYALPPDRRR